MDAPFMLLFLTLSIVIALSIKGSYLRRARGPLPPGPQPLPVIGNILDVPLTDIWRRFADLSRRYGNVMYLNVFGKPVIMLGSIQTAFDLLEKKSANFSGRPTTVSMNLLGVDILFPVMQYGRQWREHRRAFHHSFAIDRIVRHEPVQLNSTRRFLGRLFTSPENTSEHLKQLVSDTAMRTIYGIDMDALHGDTEIYETVERLRAFTDTVFLPPGHLMEVFPVLRHLPTWFPWMESKRTALEGRRLFHATLKGLDAKSTAAFESAGQDVQDCLVSRILHHDGIKPSADVREMCQLVAASAYLGSSDTTHALLEAFFLAMAMHPEKQKKAQEELDAVVGPHRLPEFSDRDALPYTHSILKEVMRWHIIVPIGLPHLSMDDDEYNGYFIPARTIINTNIWAMSKDPEEYPDPESFNPERFLEENPPRDPADYVFGFGRRICPGRHFSIASSFINFASVLHVFDIQPPLDEHGVPLKLEYRPTDTLVSHIHGYQYIIKPRSPQAELLVSDYIRNS